MQFSGMNQIVGFINQYQYFGKIWDTLAVYAHIYVCIRFLAIIHKFLEKFR